MEMESALKFQSELEKSADLHPLSRIANAPDIDFKVPWNVLLWTVHDHDEGMSGSGTLITDRAVLTAGHNICTDQDPPKDVCTTTYIKRETANSVMMR